MKPLRSGGEPTDGSAGMPETAPMLNPQTG